MSFLQAVVGILLLLLSLAGIALGLFMALTPRTREPGLYFILWWVPALASALGILMDDLVTFAIGTLCFVVAGAAFVLERRGSRRRTRGRRTSSKGAETPPSHEEARRQPASGGAKRWSFKKARQWLSGRARIRR